MMKKIQALLDRLPHWVFVGIAIAAGAFVQNLRDQPDFLSAITTWNTANLWKDLQMAAGFTLTAVIGWLRTDPWLAATNKAVAVKANAVGVPPLPIFLLAIVLSGCITSSPTVTPTPANQNQIASCQQTASLHNGVVIGDMVVGAGATGVGVAAAIPSIASSDSTRTGLALASAGLAAVTTAGAGIAALTASNFSSSHCTDVVAPLPMKPGPDGGVAALPSFGDLSAQGEAQ